MHAAVAIACSVLMVRAAAIECGQDELLSCLKSLHFNYFATDRKELLRVCPDLMNSLECVEDYTVKCMSELQRSHFAHLYSGTTTVIRDICQEGDYREEFLHHAPCMQEVNFLYEDCTTKYQEAIKHNIPSTEPISQKESDHTLREVCCSFQQYLTCSTTVVMDGCGAVAANFTKQFLDRMARPLVEGYCDKFTGECGGSWRLLAAWWLPLAAAVLRWL